MNEFYRHTQPGYLTITALGGGAAMAGYAASRTAGPGALVAFFVLGSAVLLFPSLTVVVEDRALIVYFGTGLIRRRIDLADVRAARPVRNRWYVGWGIRYIGNGWLWNVSGLQAVELELRDGRRFRVGSDEPESLASAIDAARERLR
jgi:hypothetical protein